MRSISEHADYRVDLVPEDARVLLEHGEMRRNQDGRAELFVKGRWRELCRTDLYDDVATYSPEEAALSLEEVRQYYLRHIIYGARYRQNGALSVIDSVTDG